MKRAIFLSAIVCALAAAMPRLGAQTQSPAGYPAMGESPIVTVLSPGAEPRKSLRYAVANGRRDHMNMDMLMGIAMNMGGMDLPAPQMPTMHIGADMAVTSVTPAGDISYTIKFTEMGWVPAPGVDPQMLAMLQSAPLDPKELQATATVTSRGVGRDMQLDVSKITNPQVAQIMGSLSASMKNLLMPMPEAAVGVGARWEVRQAVDAGGMRSFQMTQFELVSIDDKGCTLKTKIEQSAPPQPLVNPALPPGTDASIEKLTGSGTGTTTIHWDSLVPTSDVNLRSDMVMNMSIGGSNQQMSVVTNIKLSIAAVK